MVTNHRLELPPHPETDFVWIRCLIGVAFEDCPLDFALCKRWPLDILLPAAPSWPIWVAPFRRRRRREEGGYQDFGLFLIYLVFLAVGDKLRDINRSSRGFCIARRLPDIVRVVEELLPVLFLLLIDFVKISSPREVCYLARLAVVVASPTECSSLITFCGVVLPE
jgi:hypothetical protein